MKNSYWQKKKMFKVHATRKKQTNKQINKNKTKAKKQKQTNKTKQKKKKKKNNVFAPFFLKEFS